MNTERTQFFDQNAPVDDLAAIAEAVREERLFVPTPVIEAGSNDEESESSIDRPHRLKKVIGTTALLVAGVASTVVFGHLLGDAIDHQITHNQQVNDEYVNQSHEVNPDTVVQIPAPTK